MVVRLLLKLIEQLQHTCNEPWPVPRMAEHCNLNHLGMYAAGGVQALCPPCSR